MRARGEWQEIITRDDTYDSYLDLTVETAGPDPGLVDRARDEFDFLVHVRADYPRAAAEDDMAAAPRDARRLDDARQVHRVARRVARGRGQHLDPAARGRGIGRALAGAAEAEAWAHHRAYLRLEVRKDNPGAIRLYQSLGYRRLGEVAAEDRVVRSRRRRPDDVARVDVLERERVVVVQRDRHLRIERVEDRHDPLGFLRTSHRQPRRASADCAKPTFRKWGVNSSISSAFN